MKAVLYISVLLMMASCAYALKSHLKYLGISAEISRIASAIESADPQAATVLEDFPDNWGDLEQRYPHIYASYKRFRFDPYATPPKYYNSPKDPVDVPLGYSRLCKRQRSYSLLLFAFSTVLTVCAGFSSRRRKTRAEH